MQIPRTLREFKIELGKAILVSLFEALGIDPPEQVMREASDAHHIEAADKWMSDHKRQLRGIAVLAQRASAESSPHTSLMSDLVNNLYGSTQFLRTVQPLYFTEVFSEGTKQEGQALQEFLKLLQELGR